MLGRMATKITKSKDGTRWIKYKGIKTQIKSEASDDELISNIVKIIRLLTAKRRRKAKRDKLKSGVAASGTQTGNATTITDLALNNLRRDIAAAEAKKYEPVKLAITAPQTALLTGPPPTQLLTGAPPTQEEKDKSKKEENKPKLGFVRVTWSNGKSEDITTEKYNAIKETVEDDLKNYEPKLLNYNKKYINDLLKSNYGYYVYFNKLFPDYKTYNVRDVGNVQFEIEGNGKTKYIDVNNKSKYIGKDEILTNITDEMYLKAGESIKDKAYLDRLPPPPKVKKVELPSEPPPPELDIEEVQPGDDQQPEITAEEIAEGQAINNQNAEGSNNNGLGLYGSEIVKMMADIPEFLGVYALDQIKNIILKRAAVQSFIYNTEPISQPGGHWIAVYITPKTVEHYDSLGEDPSEEAEANIKALVGSSPQFKINNVKWQSSKSSDCGYFAQKFIRDRLAGKTWKQCSGWDIVEKSCAQGQKDIEKFKRKVREFAPL